MANSEIEVISSICKNGDVAIAFDGGIDDLFQSYKDVWEGVKKYYFSYKTLPSLDWLQTNFRDVTVVDTQDVTQFYVDKLRDQYIKNRIEATVTKHGKDLRNGDKPGLQILNELYNEFSNLSRTSGQVRDLNVTDFESAADHYVEVAEKVKALGGAIGIRTGYQAIDTAYPTGYAPGHLIYYIGYSGKMKSWFAGQQAIKAREQGARPLMLSLEMSPETMRDRIYTMMGSGEFRASQLSQGNVDLIRFNKWAQNQGNNDLIIISNDGVSDVTPNILQSKIDQYRPSIVFIDYVQLFMDNEKTAGMTPRMMNLSRQLKLLAVSNNIPIVCISAVTDDEHGRDDPPMLSQISWSKSLEYDADLALAVHRYTDSNIVEIVGRKNRHGELFDFYLDWDVDRGVIKEKFD